MRSLFPWTAIPGRAAPAVSGGRPEPLRRRTIAVSAKIIIAASALALPVSLYLFWTGLLLPFVVAIVGLGTGFLTLAMHRQGLYERAAAGQVYGTLIMGLVLTVADPAIVDFGLAVALLAPVHASMLTRTPVKKKSWIGLVIVVAFAALAATGMAIWPEPHHAAFGLVAGLTFLVVALIVAYSANQLNSAFEVYEKAQIIAYRHLIEHVQDAVLSFSSDGTLLFASRSSEHLFGCRRYELAGSGITERIHVLDRPSYLTAFAAANVDGRASTLDIRMRHDEAGVPTPRYLWVEVALSPVLVEQESPDRYEVVALLRDVTTRRDQADEMSRARKQAEDASSAKSQFLATIGHELRTPLNAIVGFSEMMTSGVAGELPPSQREYAGLIHKSGQHLIEVVNMLLDVSRIEAGRFELQTESFAPETLVEPCLQIVAPSAKDRGVRIVTDVPRNLPQFIADERACRQVLINLLSNAVKFSQPGGSVTLAIRRQGQHLKFSVADQGVGMDAAALKRLGEPFFQAHSGLARGYEGTGLGLSIVKGIVELHDGTLHAVSAPGEGTVMTVLLPINGPATKPEETAAVTPLHRDPVEQNMPEWQDDGRKRAL